MFALALWDRRDRRLHLARDRFGEKPLYYGWTRTAFVFGSELEALRRHSGFDNAIDPDAIALYMQYACVPAPYSIYKHIYKLEPGCLLSLSVPDAIAPPAKRAFRSFASRRPHP
jgi:asparagine synthase (glutamine-hydrolysing)